MGSSDEEKKAKTKYQPRSPREITEVARILLKIVPSSNFIIASAKLKQIFPLLRLKIVKDGDLPPEVEAQAIPSKWLIKLRSRTCRGLLDGDSRVLWTLAHELAHIIFQHPKKALNRTLPANLKRNSHGPWEREADIFAVKIRMPYDRVRHCKTAEEIKAVSRTSLDTSQYRLKEIRAEETRYKAISARGLPPEHFTEEFGHRADLEDLVKVLCSLMIVATSKSHRNKDKRCVPYKNNLLSTAVMIVAASELLLDAYESVRPSADDHKYRRAAALVAAILYFQPMRRATHHTPISASLVMINQKMAYSAATELLQIKPTHALHRELSSYSRVKDLRNNLSYLDAIEKDAEKLVTADGIVLSFSNFKNYELYNREHDIRWDGVDELKWIIETLRSLDSSRRSRKRAQ